MHEPSMTPNPPREDLSDACVRHEAYLRGRLRGLGVAESGLDDAVQDVFEVLVRRIGDYDPRFSLRQWMAGVARRIARRHRERDRRVPEAIDEETVASTLLDPERWASQQEALAGLREFLNALDRDRWAVFVLSEIEGLRGTEIAAELGVNLSTVYARLRTAREMFERTVARRRRRETRSWLALPLFGGHAATPVKSAAFVTPVVLVGLLSAAIGAAVVTRGCGGEGVERGPTEVEQVGAAREETQPAAEGEARAIEPAGTGLLARRGAVVGEEDAGWIDGPGGSSSRGDVSWSERVRYRMEDDELVVQVVYVGDDEEAVDFDVGWVGLEQLTLIDGAPSWPIRLAAGERRVVALRLRAKAEGVVRLDLHHGAKVGEASSATMLSFALEGGRLRPCRDGECARTAASIAESVTGVTVTVTLRNECSEAIEAVMMPCEHDAPPADAPSLRLAAGEERTVTVDEALCFGRRKADGRVGSHAGGSDGFTIHFRGEGCGGVWAEGPDDARLGIPGLQR